MRAVNEEFVDVVDRDGNVVRVATRAEVRAQRLRHRCTAVIVRSGRGEVLIHRRSDAKDLWPGYWDLVVGGVVTAGEDWEEAARRELAEEVGISGADLILVGEAAYADDCVDEVARLYAARWDGPISFPDGEVVEARWVDLDELRRRLARDTFVPDSVQLAIPYVLADR